MQYRGSPSPDIQYARNPASVPVACGCIVNARRGTNKAEKGPKPAAGADFFASGEGGGARREAAMATQLFRRAGVTQSRSDGEVDAEFQGIQMNISKVKTAAFPAGLPARAILAGAALLLALLAIPQPGNAQGIVRGAQEGSYEGNRIAGPVGGVVGGAVGAGVGGAMGAVKGVFGIPNGGYRRCRGYYNRHGHFRCYR